MQYHYVIGYDTEAKRWFLELDTTAYFSDGHVWDEDLVELNAPLPRWWLHLFNITIIFGFIYLALYPGLGNVPGVLKWTQLNQYDAEVSQAEAVQQPNDRKIKIK